MWCGGPHVSNECVRGAGAGPDTDGFDQNGGAPEAGEQPVVLRIAEAERFFEEAIGKICGAR